MSATDELRKLLDERGVEYEEEYKYFGHYLTWGENDCYSFAEFPAGAVLRIWDCTPEQAITATLGRGACHMEPIPECQYDDSECDECGVELWGFSMYKGDEGVLATPNYCPYCGAKAERREQ